MPGACMLVYSCAHCTLVLFILQQPKRLAHNTRPSIENGPKIAKPSMLCCGAFVNGPKLLENAAPVNVPCISNNRHDRTAVSYKHYGNGLRWALRCAILCHLNFAPDAWHMLLPMRCSSSLRCSSVHVRSLIGSVSTSTSYNGAPYVVFAMSISFSLAPAQLHSVLGCTKEIYYKISVHQTECKMKTSVSRKSVRMAFEWWCLPSAANI